MAVTLCLAMVSTFAVGCGQKNETDSGKSEEKSSGKVEIEFVQVKREAAESYTKVIEAFEKENPDIVIKQNVVPDAQEVLMTRASSDSLPDMMNHWPTDAQFVQFEDEGLLLDLSEKDYMKNIDSKYLDAVKAKDGKNYIAPYNVNFMGVYYNKDKFEEAGYTMPTKWDELIALAEEIKAKGETPFILPNKDSWTVSNLWSNIEARDLGSHEDEFEKMKAGEESFETIPEYKSSVEKMIQLLDYANEDSLALGYDQAINDFANGEGWMFLQGSWTLPSFLSANPDFNVEFTILPNDNGKPIATQAVDTGFCVNAKVADEPEKMEAIDKFLSFALSAEGAQIYTDNDKSPYLEIQRIRFHDCFSVEYEIERQIEQVRIVKFILQPIVENIFEHGFTMDENDNKIWIKAFKCENDIVILVKDNGCGIDSEKREELNRILCERTRRISYIDEEEKSIGINNVNTRIKNYYGEKYGVKVNKADKGTEIQLLLGIENLEEENKDK